jgi:hypothetical protein
MTATPRNRMLRLRLDSATNQLQLSQAAANQGEMQKFTRMNFLQGIVRHTTLKK